MTWSLHGTPPTGVSLSGTTIIYSGGAVASPPEIVADATDSAGNAEALEIPVAIAADSIQVNGPVVHPQQRYSLGCQPVRVRAQRFGVRALRVRSRRRLGI